MLKIVKDGVARTVDEGPATWVLEWTCAEALPPGTEVELRGANLRTLIAARWVDFACAGAELTQRVKASLTFNDIAGHNPQCVLARFRFGEGVAAGARVRLTVTAQLAGIAGAEYPLSLALRDAVVAGPVILTVSAGPVDRLHVWARPALDADGCARVLVCPLDGRGYPTAFSAPVPVALALDGKTVWEGAVAQPTLARIAPPPGAAVLRFTARLRADVLAARERIANARADGESLAVSSNPVWTAAEGGLLPLFGELHWHTNISGDGMRELRAALQAAADLLNLDFAAPGDHNPRGEDWRKTVCELDAAHVPGAFATLFGWETGSSHGHENLYFTDPDHPLVCGGRAGFTGGPPAEATVVLDRYRDFIAIPHHTNAISKAVRDDGTHYWFPYPWRAPRDDYRRLVEIFQTRGNQEREGYPDAARWRAEYTNNGGSVQTALDSGHRVGFIGGTDNHTGWPALITTDYGDGGRGSYSYAAVWAAARERQAVYDGLYARHTWACWDTRAIVRFTVDGVLQGGELHLDRPRDVVAAIRMSVEAPLEVLEVVTRRDTTIAIDTAGLGLDIELTVNLGRVTDSTYFYLRARQCDGALIYASPVFIHVAG